MKTFREALDYLYSFVSYEQKANWHYSDKTLNLDRFKQFLERLGDPQFKLKILHVAGSDGKGSTCAMLASLLRARGFRVGLYSSPHLRSIRERIQIDGRWIPPRDFVRWMNALKEASEAHPRPAHGYATFFELLTAMAFLHFLEKKVDYAVIETGLGGRLDATNVAEPLVSVITHISMEHANLLGDTLEKIADEKLGIIRSGAPVVIGHQDASVLRHMRKRLAAHQPEAAFTDKSYHIESDSAGRRYRRLQVSRSGWPGVREIEFPLLGRYQTQNALTALAALDALTASGGAPPFSAAQLKAGFRGARWPGRFEIIRIPGEAPLVMDVAHTRKGAMALRESLDELFPSRKRVFVLGVLKDKDAAGMLTNLIRPEDAVILTKAPTPRGRDPHELEAIVRNASIEPSAIQIEPRPPRALRLAREIARRGDLVVIAGSLYLVGALARLAGSCNE
ncbi:MAG: bifunctional folylpolyglutamate synthase/dihydrofolate synthase [bacterium]|nr:bifunctional folylpolyglutamate synthase/dihydrofolate synthase [bacterium]